MDKPIAYLLGPGLAHLVPILALLVTGVGIGTGLILSFAAFRMTGRASVLALLGAIVAFFVAIAAARSL